MSKFKYINSRMKKLIYSKRKAKLNISSKNYYHLFKREIKGINLIKKKRRKRIFQYSKKKKIFRSNDFFKLKSFLIKFKKFFWKNKSGFHFFLSFFFFFKPFSLINNFKNLYKFSNKLFIRENGYNFKNSFFNSLFFNNFFFFDSLKIFKLSKLKFNFISNICIIKPIFLNKIKFIKVYLKKYYFFRILRGIRNKIRFKKLKLKLKFRKNLNPFKNISKKNLKNYYVNNNLKFLLNLNPFKKEKKIKNNVNFIFNVKFKFNFFRNNSLKLQKFRLIFYFFYFTKKIKNIKFYSENSFFVKNYFQNKDETKNKFFVFNILWKVFFIFF